jgi:hypothetical protein
LGLAVAIAMLAGAGSDAQARGLRGGAKDQSFESKVQAVLASHHAAANVLYVDCGCSAETPKCCYEPCISYCYRHCRRVCCDCRPPVKAVLKVVDPRCCCYLDVPVCLPACCEGEPCITSRCALFGRSIVEYSWCCGVKVRMVIAKCGDVRVTYFGA